MQRILLAIDSGACPALVTGAGSVHKAHMASAIFEYTKRPVLLVCADEQETRRLSLDVETLTGQPVWRLAGRDFVFHNVETASRQAEQLRLRTLYAMASGRAQIVAATVEALLQRTLPKERLLQAACVLRSGKSYPPEEIVASLVAAGYKRCDQVEGAGQFALRGGILDFFSPAEDSPVRCEFFGDEIDSMGTFDVLSQRRMEMIESTVILPAAETNPGFFPGGEAAFLERLESLQKKVAAKKNAPAVTQEKMREDIERLKAGRGLPAADKYLDILYPPVSAADYLPADAIVLLCEPGRLEEQAKACLWRAGEDTKVLLEEGTLVGGAADFYRSWEEVQDTMQEYPVVMMDSFTMGRYYLPVRTLEGITAKQLPSYGGSLETAAGDIAHYLKMNFKTVVLCPDKRRAEILSAFLTERAIRNAYDFGLDRGPEPGTCSIGLGTLSAGFEYPDIRLAAITEGQIALSVLERRKKKARPSGRKKLESFTDLSPGDLVVHDRYGIGRFVGVVKMPVDKIEKDYIKIAYAGTDVLYVPATQLDLVSKYIGAGEDRTVKLSKMGGADWTKAKSRAKGAVRELAKGLLQLQAERKRSKGFAFSPDSSWQTEFEEAFEYEETDDQLRSLREIKADMESDMPMDRLLCGDVGYGKTEVALRAVMKCVLDGKQAAMLVPTTVLAQQHFVTATKRFSGYPVRIEVLSRFRTPLQMKASIKSVADGSADIVIGTHRLLQKDIRFKDLGLIVVDEEQRFGVAHKERLKEMARQVDVLTLSATPIPRTLHMALSGIRDMSTIEEPPQDRQPVQTYVLEHDWSIIADAIRREISRGGQVYYLHNRVDSIERTAAKLRTLMENITIDTAHGQMDEEQLSRVMEQMSDGELQVLVCTTIIESGIDIPNVNTLIIEDADKLGLAQLHQLRGRVGRSSRRAFAYLTFRPGKVLSEIATKRLSAIREFAEFNSGFKIAMRDLEIRGAGNLLGAEQSGHMISVGFDMYLKLLEEAVIEEKGEKPPVRTECSTDLTVSAYIPESYVPSAEQRIDLYRRIAHVRTEEDADDVTDELIDRFGDPPKSVNTLVYVALLRGEAASAGITEINQRGGTLKLTLQEIDMERISALYAGEYKGRLRIEPGKVPAVSLRLKSGGDVIAEARKFIRAYAAPSGQQRL